MLINLGLTVALAAAPVHDRNAVDRPISHHLEHGSFATSAPGDSRFAQAGSRDSLNNGARIGAVIGGIVSGVAIGYLCRTFNDDDNLQCWKPVLLWTAIGAGAGALVGTGVDALFDRRVTVRWAVRF